MSKQNFRIDLHIYPFDIMFSVGQTDAQLKAELDGIEECQTILNLMKDLSLERSNGICYNLPKGSSIIRLKKDDGSAKWKDTLVHEIFHAVAYTMSFIGASLDDSSNEAYAYLIGYITRQFYLNHN